MAKPEKLVLHTDLAPDECIRRIEASTDPGNRTIFSLSGYKGSKPLLVKFNGNQFVLWKRRYYRNDFAPYFFGTLSPDDKGSRLEGHFDMNRWVKIFMRIWIAFAVVFIVPIFFATLTQSDSRQRLGRRHRPDWIRNFRAASPEIRPLDGEGRGEIDAGVSPKHARGAARRKPIHRIAEGHRKHPVVTGLHRLFGVKLIHQLLQLKTGYYGLNLRDSLENSRRAHTSADAHRHQAISRTSPLHLLQNRRRQFCAGAAERMSQRDGASVHVHAARIKPRDFNHAE